MADDQQSNNERRFALQRIYVKDISFEVPNAPDIFREDGQPQHELNLGTKVRDLGEDLYEVVLIVTLSTKLGDKTVYLVEVHQAGIFGIRGFNDNERGPLLGSYCPTQLFPYAREVVADLISKGSFPPFLLQPVNFDALYAQHQKKVADEMKESADNATH